MTDVVIVSAARTPVGSFNGALSSLPAHELGAVAIKAAVERAGIAAADVEEVILGQVLQAGAGQGPARQAAVAAGVPITSPGWSLNQLCGSGLRAVALAAQQIQDGSATVVVAGGQESMSQSPHAAHLRNGVKMGDLGASFFEASGLPAGRRRQTLRAGVATGDAPRMKSGRRKAEMASAKPDTVPRYDGEMDPWLAVLDELPVAVSVVEAPYGPFVWHNKAAARILGLRSGRGPEARVPPQSGAIHADGRPYELHEYPLWRLLLEDAVVDREPMLYRRSDGRLLRLEVSASRVQPGARTLGICTFQDVTAEHQARHELTQAAERVELSLDAGAIVGAWVWNIPDDLITADGRVAQSFGLDPERLGASAEEMLARVHPDDLPGLRAQVADAMARGGAYRHQYRVLQADGVYRWVEASGRAELDAQRRAVRFPGVLLDIEPAKQAEDTRDLLMREVDHRARNALVMVQSIVRLTDAADPARFREEVIGRVDAMARAQGALSRSNWEGGVLHDLVREELSTCAPERQFALTGPHHSLAADQVQPLSMIMHELATNAVKHGALSTSTGKVEVSWRSDAVKAELAWRESGGPVVAPPTRTGFGSRLIARLTRQLDGVVELDWRPEGLQARLAWSP